MNSLNDQLPVRLDGSIGRALHRYRRGYGFESRSSLNFFFRLNFRNCLKCPYDQIFDFNFFTFSCTIRLLTHLAKFQSITNIRSHFILTFISENLRPPLINLVPRLGFEWEKVTSKTQTYLTG